MFTRLLIITKMEHHSPYSTHVYTPVVNARGGGTESYDPSLTAVVRVWDSTCTNWYMEFKWNRL